MKQGCQIHLYHSLGDHYSFLLTQTNSSPELSQGQINYNAITFLYNLTSACLGNYKL